MPSRFATFVVLISALGCAKTTNGDAGDTGSDASDTAGSDASDTAGTDASDTGSSECTPEADATVAFSLTDVDVGQALDWVLTCTVAAVGPSGDATSISLSDCTQTNPGPVPPPSQLELVVGSTPPSQPLVEAGGSVQLHWVQEPPFYAGRWFTLRNATGQTLLLAGIDGPSTLPPNSPSFGFGDVDVAFVGSDCELFAANDCGTGQRWALELGWDGVTTVIADSNAGFVGQLVSYRGIVDAAINYTDIVCDDFASATIVALLVVIPEG